ncbi:MAG: type VII secretion protein EssC [Defluviitaleaceae bacterium]|nr:type VII secretion protein EssC [Defluviitaleaceae bacterium]
MEFTRQPRIINDYPSGELELEAPPNVSEKPETSWFSILVMPIVTVSITVFTYMAGQSAGAGFISEPIFMIGAVAAATLSIIGSLINYNSQMRKYVKAKKNREKKYKQYIKNKENELMTAARQQADALKKNHPDPNGCVALLKNLSPNLWERTPSYGDFLLLRAGTGATKMSLRVAGAGRREAGVMETDPLAGEPRALALKYDQILDVPVCIDLKSSQVCGIAGPKEKTSAMLCNLLVQIITHHGYDDVRVIVLANEQTIKKYSWIRFMPHIWNDEMTSRYCLCGKDMAGNALAELNALFKERERRAEGSDGAFSGGLHYIFFVEDPSIIEDAQIRKFIYEPNARIGVCAVFAAEQVSSLPTGCGTVVSIKEKTAEKTDRINKEKSVFVPDAIDIAKIETAAQKAASLRIRANTSNYTLPKSIALNQMLVRAGLNMSEDLCKTDIIKNWETNRTYNGMSVPIGIGLGGSTGSCVFSLDLHETGHGPHGLVAGTTGSGKSELLQSLIISLAVNFHPHDVTFILIDYKGGGMANVFKGMPHLAGVITNLSGRQTMRALLSIKGEILRRQEVFDRYRVNNIDKYQRLYYRFENSEMKPVSHLVLIADEFAELKQDQPEFMKELVSAARVGRSLGIHLILATQKPDGVVDDQIWSNSKFKMCLKVQTEGDSNGVLKKPDAAYIKQPGRAYLQVGNDEIYELFQSAYSGADYVAGNKPVAVKNEIHTLSLDGKPTKIYPAAGSEKPADEQKNPTQLEAMVEHICSVSDVEPLEGPWTPPMKNKIYLNEFDVHIKPKNGSLLSALAAVADDPRGQRQYPHEFDFASDGNLIVYGMPGSGKSTFMRTVCLSLALRYSPDEVNMYILDMSGTGFKMFGNLPHCGGVLTIDESSSLRQFARYLLNTAENRKKIFEAENAENFIEYRKNNEMPAILILIDNYMGLSETYDDIDEQLQNLVRDSFKFGMYFVITAASDYGIRYKMSINFKMAVAFQLVDKSGYSNVVGRTEGLEPEDFPGRGLVRLPVPLELHAFLPELHSDGETASTKEIIDSIAQTESRRAVPIPVMPEKISFEKLNGGSGLMNIGLADFDLAPVSINLADYTALMISGDAGTGKSTLVTTWLSYMKDTVIYAVDSNSMGLMSLYGKENFIDLREKDIDEFTCEFENFIDGRREELIEARRSGGGTDALLDGWQQIVFVFDKMSEFSENLDYENFKDLLVRIINRERGLKITVIALDTLDGFSGDYETVTKTIKKEQTGILLGSMKDQSLFDSRLPYGAVEKEIMFGDGYLIKKAKHIGFRAAF